MYPFTQLKTGKFPILLGMITLAAVLVACTPDQNDLFIQGRWYHNSPHLLSVVGESYLETYWTFDRGTYQTHSCCFARHEQSGRYTILNSEGNTLTLEFFNINGKLNSERFQVGVKIDPETGTIRIQGSGPFERIYP
jgi:major membrane immunogen (membrane-anchored lipoprotein)